MIQNTLNDCTKVRKCSEVQLGPVALLAQLVEQWTGVPGVVGSSPMPGTYNFLPYVTLLVSKVIRIIYLKHQHETPQTC